MSRPNRWTGFALLACLALSILALGSSMSSGQGPAAKPAIWEYKSIWFSPTNKPPEDLNAEGKQGWELVSVAEADQFHHVIAVFKRAKP
ncbi:hypothetical protein OJF2_65180 [Aquisphaera giovannonii]|uniref:DUF4177 domain-containing protein n=1 Tax=Aquisphaera giovannonii TaxID=406548 RepID=A0A5B9WBS5_9BACT|nr:hypothetical protein OJF2_65180 [Aquisphaera giovannonii]